MTQQKGALVAVKYRWKIHTADVLYAGTSGDVYLSLHGLDASMKEVLLPNPDSLSFDRDQTDTGLIDVAEDLGEIDSGVIRTDGNTSTNPWRVDWVQITNLDDGREWTASDVGVADAQGRLPILKFKKTDNGLPEPPESSDDNPDDSSSQGDSERATTEQLNALGERVTALEAEISSLKSSLGLIRSAPQMVTTEIFGMLRGGLVPLKQVLSGNKVVAGGAICATSSSTEGFGLAGVPGKWLQLFPGVNPSDYGLDPQRPVVATDGQKVWPLSAKFLEQLLGANWRDSVFGSNAPSAQ